jgi:translation initiation factor 2 beta subunit (eIF-2beta)/eIF-5
MENDFEDALQHFGINALLSRAIQLSSPELRPLLKDFRQSWQLLEIERIRAKTPGLTMLSAHTIYTLCQLLDPPNDLPGEKHLDAEILAGPLCSPWTSVIALRHLGAFRDSR